MFVFSEMSDVIAVIPGADVLYWFSLNRRKSARAVDTLVIESCVLGRHWGMLKRFGKSKGSGTAVPLPSILRRTPNRLSLARRTPPELAFVSPVDWIIRMFCSAGKFGFTP
jgi:hypothetical protein